MSQWTFYKISQQSSRVFSRIATPQSHLGPPVTLQLQSTFRPNQALGAQAGIYKSFEKTNKTKKNQSQTKKTTDSTSKNQQKQSLERLVDLRGPRRPRTLVFWFCLEKQIKPIKTNQKPKKQQTVQQKTKKPIIRETSRPPGPTKC